MKKNAIKDKSYVFALHTIRLYKFLTDSKKEFIISRQILKAGTSIGAQVREGEQAESKADFIHKMSIALKEANEVDYWLSLLKDSGYIDIPSADTLNAECNELISLLTAIIKTSKNSIK